MLDSAKALLQRLDALRTDIEAIASPPPSSPHAADSINLMPSTALEICAWLQAMPLDRLRRQWHRMVFAAVNDLDLTQQGLWQVLETIHSLLGDSPAAPQEPTGKRGGRHVDRVEVARERLADLRPGEERWFQAVFPEAGNGAVRQAYHIALKELGFVTKRVATGHGGARLVILRPTENAPAEAEASAPDENAA